MRRGKKRKKIRVRERERERERDQMESSIRQEIGTDGDLPSKN